MAQPRQGLRSGVMICPRCEGDGMILVSGELRPYPWPSMRPWAEPCPDCGGSGVAYCCEGANSDDEDDT